MFGRRRDEDYDAYNEKYSSKYDDDYIAPSEEYRSECDHDHEQTYDDMTDVRECDHSHEQTYDDITNVRDCDHSHEQTRRMVKGFEIAMELVDVLYATAKAFGIQTV